MTMPSLPVELFPHILKHLPLEHLKSCSLANSALHGASIALFTRHLSLGILELRHLDDAAAERKLHVIQQSPWKERVLQYTQELSIGEALLLSSHIVDFLETVGDNGVVRRLNIFCNPQSEEKWTGYQFDPPVMQSLRSHLFSHIRSLAVIGMEDVSLPDILDTYPHLEELSIEPQWINDESMTFAYFRRLSSLALRRMVLSFRSPWDGNRCGNPWKSVMALVESSTRTLKSLTLRPCIRPGSIVSDLIRKRYRALETLALTIAPDECDENPFPFAMFPCLRTLAIDLEFLKPLDADVLFRSLALQLRSAADTCPTLRTLEVHALDLTTKFLTQIKPSRTLNDMSATSPITFIFVLQMPYLYEQNMNLDGLFYSAARCVKTWLPAWEERGRLKVVKSQPLQGPWSFR